MPAIRWFLNGAVVNLTTSPVEDPRRNITTRDPSTGRKQLDAVLEYNSTPTSTQNGDRVECRVRNPIDGAEEKSTSVILNVTFPPTSPRIQLVHANRDWIVAAVDRLQVSCELSDDGAVGNPPAELALYRDGFELKASVGETKVEYVTLVAREDDGVAFHCQAKNSIGVAESEKKRIRVAYGPSAVSVNVSASKVKAGETVTLHCAVEGTSPPPIIQWLKDGEIFQTGSASNAIPEDQVSGCTGGEMVSAGFQVESQFT